VPRAVLVTFPPVVFLKATSTFGTVALSETKVPKAVGPVNGVVTVPVRLLTDDVKAGGGPVRPWTSNKVKKAHGDLGPVPVVVQGWAGDPVSVGMISVLSMKSV